MEKILGIDAGTNSLGWCIRNTAMGGENQIEKYGVLIFNKGVGKDKTGEYSYAAQRTSKRAVRRLYQARKYRLWDTLKVLIDQGYCPMGLESLDKWRKYSKEEALLNENGGRRYPVEDVAFEAWIKLDFNGDGIPDYKSPYQLRKELAEEKLDFEKEEDRFKLGRALYHIAQRRGFKSSRKAAKENNEKEGEEELDLQLSEKKKNKEIELLFEKYTEAKTIGVLFGILENNGERIREKWAQHAIRENYKDEVNHIFDFQGISKASKFYTGLVETGKNKNDGAIFYKRPLRSQKGLVGLCTFEQTTHFDSETGRQFQTGKYRAPVSHPSFEKFRALCFINNIKYKPQADAEAELSPLPQELRDEVYQKLFFRKKAHFPFVDIADFINKKGHKWEFNYKLKTSVSGCPVSARLKSIWGDDFWSLQIPKPPSPNKKKTFYDLEDIWHVLFTFEDQEYVEDFAANKLKLDEKECKELVRVWNAMPVGYAMLSLHALNKINPLLEKGLIYTEAVLLAKVSDVIGEDIWQENEQLLIKEVENLIDENRTQKKLLHAINSLISKHKNLPDHEKYSYTKDYALTQKDKLAIDDELIAQFGKKGWEEVEEEERLLIKNAAIDCYQAYFQTSGFELRYINEEKYFLIKSNGRTYCKSSSGYYKLPRLVDVLGDFLVANFDADEELLKKLYHPSMLEFYPKAKEDIHGEIKLGSPKTGAFKNPMAMRTLHELRKLINYLIKSGDIDQETRVVVEIARELNDANKRWAIETWQRRREEENKEFEMALSALQDEFSGTSVNPKSDEDIDKMRIWYEQKKEEKEVLPEVTNNKKEVKGLLWQTTEKESYKEIKAKKEMIDKYRLWKEQDCLCIYTGKPIKFTDLFKENVIDFEHTIPASVSFDNSLANLTVCYADYNRNVKKKNIPFNLPNYDRETPEYTAILPRLEKWLDKVERIKQQIDYWKGRSKRAATKKQKDDAIRQKHLWQMDYDYWKNKIDRFLMEEVTDGFKNSQKIDTQLISKYAYHYLKSYFDKVTVQKGSVTAIFRKMYGLQTSDEAKDRSLHSHHAKDAAILTLIPANRKRDELLEKYFEYKEKYNKTYTKEPYKGFKREEVQGIDDNIFINNIINDQSLTPAKKRVRKRGKLECIKDTNKPKIATGDCIRGQLHQETFFGAIKLAEEDENGKLKRDESGNFVQKDKVEYVVRVPLTYKKSASDTGSFSKLKELEKVMVDKSLYAQIEKQVKEVYNDSFRDALEQGVYMLDKNGNKVNKIRRVRVFKSVSDPLVIKKQTYLSKHDYKQYYYAGNGENIAYGFYECVEKQKKTYQIINLFDAARLKKTHVNGSGQLRLEEELKIKKDVYKLKAIFKSGQKVIFYTNSKEALREASNKELSDLLYKIEGFEKDGRIRFKHHLNAQTDQKLKEVEEVYGKGIYQGFSSLNNEFPWPKLKMSVSNLDIAIEGVDFEVMLDGEIKWLF